MYLTGYISDRFFGSRRGGVSLAMMIGMTAATVLLIVFRDAGVEVFIALLGLVGFTLYGPDALLTGAGAMDIGGRRAATFATAVISGFGSLGPIVQEVVIGRLYNAKSGDLSADPRAPVRQRRRGGAVLRGARVAESARGPGDLSGVFDTLGILVGAPSILIVHPDRKTQRTVQRILGTTGYRVDIADDIDQGTRLLAHLAPVLVVVDGAMVGRPLAALIDAARERGSESCMTLLGAHAASQIPGLLDLGAVTNLFVHPMPVLGEELTITTQKLIRGDLFGAEKYLLWGTDLHETQIVRASQRSELIGEPGRAGARAGPERARRLDGDARRRRADLERRP